MYDILYIITNLNAIKLYYNYSLKISIQLKQIIIYF